MKAKKWFGKKAVSLFLSTAMLVSMLPLQALAAETGGNGATAQASQRDAKTVAADTGRWKLQEWGENEDIEAGKGWITPTEDGNGFTLDYAQLIADRGKEGIVVYDSEAEACKDSTLELDITLTKSNKGDGEDQARFYSAAVLPLFQDGKNCEGLGIHDTGRLEHAAQIDGTEGAQDWVRTDKGDFVFGETYHLKLVTEKEIITVSAAKKGEALQELTSFTAKAGLGAGGYGFRFWRGAKTIKVENVVRTKLQSSYLEQEEQSVASDAWGNQDVAIPVSFAQGDSVVSVTNGAAALSLGDDYSVTGDSILLKQGYIARQADKFTLTITFQSGVTGSFTLMKRSDVGKAQDWVMQRQSEDQNAELQDGWITSTEDGDGVVINYGKIVADTGNQGWVFYDSAAEQYQNSSLEYDITFSNSEDGTWIATALAPRVASGKDYEGFAITEGTGLERTGRRDGAESYAGIGNLLGVRFEYNKTYHLRMETVDNNITVYLTRDGKEEKLTSFESPIGLDKGSYGFRVWRGGKTITLENIKRSEIITSTLDRGVEQIKKEAWGQADVSVPIHFGKGDYVASVYNGETELIKGTDYTVADDTLTLKKEYIAAHSGSFRLQVNFAKGSVAALWVMEYDPLAQQEYVWTPDQGIDMWKSMEGNGAIEEQEDGMRVTGRNLLVNELAPLAINGEIEITFDFLNDNWQRDQKNHGIGFLFRADPLNGAWQSLAVNGYVSSQPNWDFINSDGASAAFTMDGDCFLSRDGVKDYKIKGRFENDSLTLWMDDQVAHSAGIKQCETIPGNMGLMFNGDLGDILVKKVVFREVNPMQEETGDREMTSIANGGLTVRLDQDFPRVADYSLNGKKLNGSELRYNYVTINSVNMPATAEITAQSADSVTYHVTPDSERSGVTFDVEFTVLKDQILEMRIVNIMEPEGEPVNSIGLPNQPLISANSSQAGARLDASWVSKRVEGWGIKDLHETIADKNISTTAGFAVAIPIITTDGLSASMFNNVYLDGDEFVYRAFNLPDGEVTAGFWNNEFMYRGLDGEKILPFASEPEENDLYCRVAVTDDTNGDGQMDWQDGANALKKLTSDAIPGGGQAARRFFHVGYNFASGAQQPFLKVADNMKRLSNFMDGFGQNLVFKGYANEGHDSGHADYEDINRRAGGADGMNVAIDEADKINSDFGIHINHAEAYPEAKMFNDHTMSGMDGWRWMDQSRYIRRDVDMIEGTFDARLDSLFDQTPDLDFVYVDCWEGDRWGELKLVGNMLRNGAEMFATENAPDLQRFGVWVHSTGGTSSNGIHQFVYNTQKDVYPSSSMYWGGYNRGVSMMSWQHNNNINSLVEQFYTNQLPQKYLMCHEVLKQADNVATFEGNVTSSNWVITKDGNKVTDGQGKIFIPWYDEESETQNPDEAAKIYHWNAGGGETTWNLPATWADRKTVYLYETTQTGKKFVESIEVTDGKVTINADARTPYVVYPGEAAADVTEWSVGSPLKDTSFNSRDFSIWAKGGDADIAFNDDGNGVSILTMTGAEIGHVSQTMEGLESGQKYRVLVYAGAENGKTARLTVKTPDGMLHENYVEQVVMNNQYFDNYAKNKKVQLMWVDFVQPEGASTAVVTLSADACEDKTGKATFMETRIVKTAEPNLPEGYVANETFEYVEQGAYGIFNPERSADGVPHLSETHLPYTDDTITGDWSLKLYGHYGQGDVTVRTSPATARLAPNTEYTVEFDTLGDGRVYVQSEADGNDQVLNESFQAGHSKFTFTTGEKTDYIVRIERGRVLDNFSIKNNQEINKSTLNFVLELAKAHVKNGDVDKLIPTAKEQFNNALNKAQAIYDNPNATQDEADAAWKTLMEVIHALGFVPGDKTELTELVAAAAVLDLTKYEDGAEKEAFVAALKAAEDLIADPDAMKLDIDAAYKALDDAMQNLIPKPVAGDKTELKKVIDEANVKNGQLDKYVDDAAAKKAFADALQAANDMYAKDGATQDEIDGAKLDLLTAMAGLRLRADKSSLNDWLDELKAIDLTEYTAESAEVVRAVIAKAEALAAQDLSEDDMERIQAMVAEMENAKAQLEKAPAEPENPEDPEESSKPDDTSKPDDSKPDEGNASKEESSSEGKDAADKAPTTGDSLPVALLSVMALASAGAWLLSKRRK